MNYGVYQIKHLSSGKVYIGSASYGDGIDLRFRQHRNQLEQNKHYATKLQRAWNKYGADAFVFEVLLYCDPENCLMYEQVALDHYKPAYNSAKNALHPMKGRKHTAESKQKISLAHRGKVVSEETRVKLSAIYKARDKKPHTGCTHSEATKSIISKKLQDLVACGIIGGEKHHSAKLTEGDVRHIRQLHEDGRSLRFLSEKFGVAKATIHHIIKRRTWKYVN